jgi:cytochrome c oxidase assembly protein subunit 15
MAVPDWPNTFGYNMFFFPVSQWVGGVFYEHTHRLLASGVGLLTSILALWLHGTKARTFLRWSGIVLLFLGLVAEVASPTRWADAIVIGISGLVATVASFVWPWCQPAVPWLRKLGIAAFLAVVLQGVLGGLRVVLFKDQIGIFHATLAQLFFGLVCALALFTSPWWQGRMPIVSDSSAKVLGPQEAFPRRISNLSWLCLIVSLVVLFQLVLGATMRHQHAGLAIPDFPLAYGKIWPAMDAQSVLHYNQQRLEIVSANPITVFQIVLQMVHRLLAACILGGVASSAWLARRQLGFRHPIAKLTLAWLGLIVLQALLGAATIWSNKAADVATAHVLVGALSLAFGGLLSILSLSEFGNRSIPTPVPQHAEPSPSFGPSPSPAVGFK